MIAEVLCVLAGHPSSIFTPSAKIVPEFRNLLHSGEIQTLESLVHVASKYRHVKDATKRLSLSFYPLLSKDKQAERSENDPRSSEYLSTMGSALNKVLVDYESLVVETEKRVLCHDAELVGTGSFVPLSSIWAVFSVWETPLSALDSLITQLYKGPGNTVGAEDSVPDDAEFPHWPPGPLIDLLLHRANTGVNQVASIMSRLAVSVQSLWRIHLTAFVTHGSLSSIDPLATGPPLSQAKTMASHYSAFVLSDAAIPSCISPQTRDSILYIGKAVATMKAQGQSHKQIPRQLAIAHAKKLNNVLPQDDYAFDRVIADIRTAVSEFLWTHVLMEKDVGDAVESLANYFLLRNGEFAVSLIREIERLKVARLSARGRAGVIREQDLSLALLRSSLGTNAQHDASLSKLKFTLPSGPIRTLLPGLGMSLNRSVHQPSISPFADLLLGTPLVLTYQLSWPLDLFLVPSDLQAYSHLFSYFSAIRRAQHLTLECWTSLSNAQRSRRRWTGQDEGGTADVEARKRLLRCGWGVLRQLLWFLDTLWSYLVTDVVSAQYEKFKEDIWPSTNLEPKITPSGASVTSRKDSQSGTVRPTTPSEAGGTARPLSSMSHHTTTYGHSNQRNKPKTPLDFTTLRALHSRYLNNLLVGSLLANPTCSTIIRTILDVCDQFVGQLERWGGDVLPALLFEGSITDHGSNVGEMVKERMVIVQDINETLNDNLTAFYEHLSQTTSLAPNIGVTPDASGILNTSALALGLSSFRVSTLTKSRRGESDVTEGEARRTVEHLLLRLDFNAALSRPGFRMTTTTGAEGDNEILREGGLA
ncbi:hypothetical protein FRC02_004290 [Tulasnella sp. 418]|nr:hypothetical protein FRC02_004290 [Tulasnella sp. 418]